MNKNTSKTGQMVGVELCSWVFVRRILCSGGGNGQEELVLVLKHQAGGRAGRKLALRMTRKVNAHGIKSALKCQNMARNLI